MKAAFGKFRSAKVVFTDATVDSLHSIATYLVANYPSVAAAVERRLRIVMARIARWPESAQRVIERPGVRVVLLVRYPPTEFLWDNRRGD